jgi:hypothetical protein
MGNRVESAAQTWRRRLLSVPGIVAGTALTAAVSWGATELIKNAKSKIGTEQPIAVSIEMNPARTGAFSDEGVALLLPSDTRARDDPGPGCDGFRPWARSHGGIDTGATKLVLIVQGKVDKAVLISGMRVSVISRSSPMHGIPVACASAGAAQNRAIEINLDRRRPHATYRSGSGAPFGFTVAKGETETFNVVATTHHGRYRWVIKLDLVVGGRKQTIRVDDHGRPFETTPSPKEHSWSWNYRNEWALLTAGGDTVRRAAGNPLTPP